jgi:hypothetical protein
MRGSTLDIQFAELPVFNQQRAKKFYTGHFDCEVASEGNRLVIGTR